MSCQLRRQDDEKNEFAGDSEAPGHVFLSLYEVPTGRVRTRDEEISM